MACTHMKLLRNQTVGNNHKANRLRDLTFFILVFEELGMDFFHDICRQSRKCWHEFNRNLSFPCLGHCQEITLSSLYMRKVCAYTLYCLVLTTLGMRFEGGICLVGGAASSPPTKADWGLGRLISFSKLCLGKEGPGFEAILKSNFKPCANDRILLWAGHILGKARLLKWLET